MAQTNFHYTPTGTGAISGREVLTQTEDAINDIGCAVNKADRKSNEALQTSKNALDIVEGAKEQANQAVSTANSAISKVDTLDQIVHDWDANIKTAKAESASALEIAGVAKDNSLQAISKSDSAKATADNALNVVNNALTVANNAVVTAGNAETKADQAVATANQAKADANSAMQSAQDSANVANALKAEAYALRYVNDSLVISQEVDLADMTPQGNIKVGDQVLDKDGKLFQIALMNATTQKATLSNTFTELTSAVSYSHSQALSEDEQKQARDNIRALDDSQVLMTAEQELTTEEKGWASWNGGLVSYLAPQVLEPADTDDDGTPIPEINTALTDAQKAQARLNINACSPEDLQKVKNDLLNGAGQAYDTLKELGDLIDENHDAIAALETVAGNHVSYAVAQDLTDAQKKQARDNIGVEQLSEMALPSNVMLLEGDQTVAGNKTFTGDVAIKKKTLTLQSARFAREEEVSSYQESQLLQFNGTCGKSVAKIINAKNTDGTIGFFFRSSAGDNEFLDLRNYVNYETGKGYLCYWTGSNTTLNLPSGDSSAKIPTTAWVQSELNSSSKVVHTTGNEEISGDKMFRGTVKLKGSSLAQFHIAGATRGSTPTANTFREHWFFDDQLTWEVAHAFGSLGNGVYTDGTVKTYLRTYKNVEGGSANAEFSLTYPSSGSAYASLNAEMRATAYQSTSDRRLKEDIAQASFDLSSLKPYRYTLKEDGKRHVGLIAQEVEKVIPEAVSEREDGYLTLDYNAVVAALVGEVNSLKAEIAELKKNLKEDK